MIRPPRVARWPARGPAAETKFVACVSIYDGCSSERESDRESERGRERATEPVRGSLREREREKERERERINVHGYGNGVVQLLPCEPSATCRLGAEGSVGQTTRTPDRQGAGDAPPPPPSGTYSRSLIDRYVDLITSLFVMHMYINRRSSLLIIRLHETDNRLG